MNLRDFIYNYFRGWNITSWTCGADCGNMKLISGETCIAIFFNMNGETHWSGNRVTVDHVSAY